MDFQKRSSQLCVHHLYEIKWHWSILSFWVTSLPKGIDFLGNMLHRACCSSSTPQGWILCNFAYLHKGWCRKKFPVKFWTEWFFDAVPATWMHGKNLLLCCIKCICIRCCVEVNLFVQSTFDSWVDIICDFCGPPFCISHLFSACLFYMSWCYVCSCHLLFFLMQDDLWKMP